MAITRCPYCHAIIDENDKYCNNCGTQLLFSEDEEVEEEIPGEKIIEAEVEEKDYTVNEPEGEKRPKGAKDLDSEIDEELEDELPEKAKEMALDEIVAQEVGEEVGDDVTEEVILVDEIKAVEEQSKDGRPPLGEGKIAAEMKGPEPEARMDEDEGEEEGEEDEEGEEELAGEPDLEEEIEEEVGDKEGRGAGAAEKPGKEDEAGENRLAAVEKSPTTEIVQEPPARSKEEADFEYVSENDTAGDAATAGDAGLRPVTFDSKELENLGRTVELSGQKVDKFLEVMAQKTVMPPSPAQPAPAERPPGKHPEPSTGTLPPWASTMKGAPVFPEDTGAVETRQLHRDETPTPETGEEIEIFPRRRAPDSTIGLPEKVGQAHLPFERPATRTGESGVEAGEHETDRGEARDLTPEEIALSPGHVRPAREPILPDQAREPVQSALAEIELVGEGEESATRPPFSFSVFVKSKTFDILFVGVFWLAALWLAAYSMGMTLFDILGSMSGSMLLLYAAFVLLYFFLFKFFLGETLGDRLFRPRE